MDTSFVPEYIVFSTLKQSEQQDILKLILHWILRQIRLAKQQNMQIRNFTDVMLVMAVILGMINFDKPNPICILIEHFNFILSIPRQCFKWNVFRRWKKIKAETSFSYMKMNKDYLKVQF